MADLVCHVGGRRCDPRRVCQAEDPQPVPASRCRDDDSEMSYETAAYACEDNDEATTAVVAQTVVCETPLVYGHAGADEAGLELPDGIRLVQPRNQLGIHIGRGREPHVVVPAAE